MCCCSIREEEEEGRVRDHRSGQIGDDDRIYKIEDMGHNILGSEVRDEDLSSQLYFFLE